MAKLFSTNIGRTGRILRGLGGVALISAGVLLYPIQFWAFIALLISGAFMLFEAFRGWCVARACGVKTRW